MQFKRLGITADHAGGELKNIISGSLQAKNLHVVDYGLTGNEFEPIILAL